MKTPANPGEIYHRCGGKNRGIEYAVNKMNEYKEQALQILATYPESETRKGFEDLVNFVTDRKY
jgi:octaprenyl-diphosphate synthase